MASSCITSKQRAAKEVEMLMESIFETTPWWSNDVLQPYLDNLTVKVQERKDALQTRRGEEGPCERLVQVHAIGVPNFKFLFCRGNSAAR